MQKPTEEFISARLEELEEVLRGDEEFQKQTKILHEVSQEFRNRCGMSKDEWRLYGALEEMLIGNNILYSKAAYRLGYSDGWTVGQEQRPEGRTLSLEDMTNLISVYDCVKKMKELLLGDEEKCRKKEGGFTVFEEIYNIIEHTTNAEIRLQGEDEAFERVTDILDKKITVEERAKELLGIN